MHNRFPGGNLFQSIFVLEEQWQRANCLTLFELLGPTGFDRLCEAGCSMQAHGVRALTDNSKPYVAKILTPWLLNLTVC